MRKTILAVSVLLLTCVVSFASFASKDKPVATLDGETITAETLATYVETVAGSKYKTWLSSEDGLRKLADFYINRKLMLAYAKQTISREDTVVSNHSARSVEGDVMYLSALLQQEIQNKVMVSETEVRAYMETNGLTSERQARDQVESEQRNRLMEALVAKVRAGHAIEIH